MKALNSAASEYCAQVVQIEAFRAFLTCGVVSNMMLGDDGWGGHQSHQQHVQDQPNGEIRKVKLELRPEIFAAFPHLCDSCTCCRRHTSLATDLLGYFCEIAGRLCWRCCTSYAVMLHRIWAGEGETAYAASKGQARAVHKMQCLPKLID